MRRILPALMALFVFAAAALPAAAQLPKDLPEDLGRAAGLLEAGRHAEALAAAESHLRGDEDGPWTAAALLIAGRAEVRLNRGNEALARAQAVLAGYREQKNYAAQAHYLAATAHQVRGDAYEAARSLVACLDAEPPEELARRAETHLVELAEGTVAYRASTLLLLAERPGTRRVLEAVLPQAAEQPIVGILLPEAEGESDPGRDLLRGARIADSLEAQRQPDRGVRIELLRVPPDPARAAWAARSLAREMGVWGLIAGGPESFVIPAALEAQASGTPVILPGQRRPTLNLVGRTAVIPEADWRREGRIAASYAVDSLGLRTFGIVAPYTDRGQENVTGFLEVLEEHPRTRVLSQEWYFPEEGVSLARQFQRLRTIGFRTQYRDSLLEAGALLHTDSLLAVLDTLSLPERIHLLDTLQLDLDEALPGVDTLATVSLGDSVLPDTAALAALFGFRAVLRDSLVYRKPTPGDSLEVPGLPPADREADTTLVQPEPMAGGIYTIQLRSWVRDSVRADSLALAGLGVDTLVLDSLLERAQQARFEELWSSHMDSIQRTTAYKQGEIDSNDIALHAFDALYLPIEPGRIELMAPQFAFYNFVTTKIGNDAWYEPEQLYRNRQYVQDLIFTAPYVLERTEGKMQDLRMALGNGEPGRASAWHIRGFDAMLLLEEAMRGDTRGPGEVGQRLRALDEVELAAGVQTFGEESLVGQTMWLLSVESGVVGPEEAAARLEKLRQRALPDSLAPEEEIEEQF